MIKELNIKVSLTGPRLNFVINVRQGHSCQWEDLTTYLLPDMLKSRSPVFRAFVSLAVTSSGTMTY